MADQLLTAGIVSRLNNLLVYDGETHIVMEDPLVIEWRVDPEMLKTGDARETVRMCGEIPQKMEIALRFTTENAVLLGQSLLKIAAEHPTPPEEG